MAALVAGTAIGVKMGILTQRNTIKRWRNGANE